MECEGGVSIENVPHNEWLELSAMSHSLQRRARFDKSLWDELSILNRRVRALAAMPTTRETWPTRSATRHH